MAQVFSVIARSHHMVAFHTRTLRLTNQWHCSLTSLIKRMTAKILHTINMKTRNTWSTIIMMRSLRCGHKPEALKFTLRSRLGTNPLFTKSQAELFLGLDPSIFTWLVQTSFLTLSKFCLTINDNLCLAKYDFLLSILSAMRIEQLPGRSGCCNEFPRLIRSAQQGPLAVCFLLEMLCRHSPWFVADQTLPG